MRLAAGIALFLLICCSGHVKGQEEGMEANLLVYPDTLITVVPGSAARLTCVAYGNPGPTVAWFKDGTEIQNGSNSITIYETFIEETNMSFTQSILEICSILPKHEGNYSCFTKNEFGNKSIVFQIDVIYAEVSILESSTNTIANITDVVSFFCSASGNPLPSISWFKDGIPLNPNTVSIRSNITNNGTLVISVLDLGELQLADAGQYLCNASDIISGTDAREFTLTVEKAVVLAVHPSNASLSVGANTAFTCIAAGIPPPQISWLKDGRPIIDANITQTIFSNVSGYFAVSIFYLSDLSFSDSGLYSCQTSNNISQGQTQASASFYLQVQDSPKILTGPVNQTVSESSDLQLSCTVSGVPLPQVSWWMETDGERLWVTENNGTVVNESLSQESDGVVRSTLTVMDVDLSLAGVYECMATNSLGTDTAQALVTVYVVPSILPGTLTNLSVLAGSTGDLVCVARGFPVPTVSWFRNGMQVNNDSYSNVIVVESFIPRSDVHLIQSSLKVDPFLPNVQGNFTCQVVNDYGMQAVDFILQVVTGAVSIMESPSNTVANITDVVSFFCSASGIPLPSIFWFKDGIPLNSNTVSISSNITNNGTLAISVLDLGELQLADAGQYLCNASDIISGTDAREFTLTVEKAVVLAVHPSNASLSVGANTAFTCIAAGIPPPQISWLKDGRPIIDANITQTIFSNVSGYFAASILSLCDLSFSDSGLYSCQTSNNISQGQAQAGASFYLQVQDSPKILTGPVNQTVSESSDLQLSCTVSGVPLPQVSWWIETDGTRLQVTENNGTVVNENLSHESDGIVKSTLTVMDVDLSLAGVYECMATNSLGTDTAQALVTVYVVPSILPGTLTNLSVLAGSTGDLVCVARGFPVPTVSWFRNGMQVNNDSYSNVIVVESFIPRSDVHLIQSSLKVDPFLPNVQGNFTCQVVNDYGMQAVDFILQVVTGAVSIMESPSNTIANITDVVSFFCSASGIPLPSIFWFKDGIPLNSNTVSISSDITNNGTLAISVLDLGELQLADAGQYLCNASNIISGTDAREFTLTVEKAVVLVVYMSNASLSVGANTAFTCIAAGIPPPQISWLKDGRPIIDANITQTIFSNVSGYFVVSILSLCDLSFSDSGLYSCQTSNNVSQGQAQAGASFYLQVQGEPVWVVHPTPDLLIVPEGLTFSLNCTATGFPTPSINWIRNGTTLPTNGTSVTTSVLNFYTRYSRIVIGPAAPYHAGAYRCVADGETTSGLSVSVTSNYSQVIFTSPPDLRMAPSDHAVFRIMDVTITCQFQSLPAANVSWTYMPLEQGSIAPVQLSTGNEYNITNMITFGEYNFFTTSVLLIRNVTIDDAGEYSCSGSNGIANLIGAVSTGVARLYFETNDPVFVTMPDDTVVLNGSMTTLRCAAASNSSLILYWTKDGMNITLPAAMEFVNDVTSYHLIITSAANSDNGVYTCHVRSNFYQRTISSSANLVVHVPASIVASPENTTVSFGNNISFSCVAVGSHNITILWTKDGALLSSDITKQTLNFMFNSTLVLTNVTLNQTGTYRCSASNDYLGIPQTSDGRDFDLFVQRKPLVIPTFDQIDAKDKMPFINIPFLIVDAVPMVAEKDIHPNFTRYDGTFPLFNTSYNPGRLIFTIEKADIFEHEGNYTVSASNPAGSSLGTVSLDIKSGPVTFSLNVSGDVMYDANRTASVALETRSVIFSCSFYADPEPVVKWFHNGSPIQTQQTNKNIITNFNDIPPIGLTYSQLTLSNVVAENSGNYSCQGNNTYGINMVSQRLAVLVPPTVATLNSQVVGVQTRDGSYSGITLGFTITRAEPSVPLGDIIWTYTRSSNMEETANLAALTGFNDTKFNFTDDLLSVTIMNLSLFDAGIFTLSASNEAGRHNASVELTIDVEPMLLNYTSSGSEAKEKSSITFTCVADGLPLPKIIWLHNDTLILTSTLFQMRHRVAETFENSTYRPHIPMATSSTLTVSNLQLKDRGSYVCRVDTFRIDKGRPDFSPPFTLTVNPVSIDYCTPNPCKNGGVCSNITLNYLCTCTRDWTKMDCTQKVQEFIKVDITEDPVVDFPEIFQPVTFTCEVVGTPTPKITWYKNGKPLEGEENVKLIIQEVGLLDRGFYSCNAVNYDPNIPQDEENMYLKKSEQVVLNIKGIAQYRAILRNLTPGRRRKRESGEQSDVFKLASQLSGVNLGNNITIYSVNKDPTSSGDVAGTPILVTLIAPQGGSQDVTTSLTERLTKTGSELGLKITDISRFDGCKANKTELPSLEPDGLNVILEWPETDIGKNESLTCPCGNLSSVSKQDISKMAYHYCGGDFTEGAKWSTLIDAPCNFSSTTRRLCQVANLIGDPQAALGTLDDITKKEDTLGSNEIEVTTILLETLTIKVVENRTLSTNFLVVVDNLLDANVDEIQKSQAEANTSARILVIVEDVAEGFPIPENETSVIIPFTSFAITVQEVEPETFAGQVFSAQLGNDFNFDKNKTIDAESLKFSGSPMETASISIPKNIFENLNKINSSTLIRISNALFLSDALFPRRNEKNLTVGSIIIAASITGNGIVENLVSPIVLTFRKRPSLLNGTNASCNFWDLIADDGFGDWSLRGCKVVNETETQVKCECDHLTNFAMLLDPNPVDQELPEELEKALDTISYLGAIVSIVCLIATIVTYLSSQKLRMSEAGQLLMNLSFALLGLYIMFIASLHATANRYVCAVAGGLLHYFMLATFLAMAAEAINLYTKLVLVLGVPLILKNRYVLKASLVTWILPLIIVVISEAPKWENYVSTFFCRPFYGGFYGGLLTPFILIYIFNWIVFIIIFVSLLRKKSVKVDSKNNSKFNFRQNFIIAATLSLLFGLGWGIGLTATTSIPNYIVATVLQVLFILLTGFQGLFIFLMHCIRSEEARKQWKAWIYIITWHKVKFTPRESTYAGRSSTSHGDYGYRGTHGRFNKYGTSSKTNSDLLKKAPFSSSSSTVMNSGAELGGKQIVFNPTFEDMCEEKHDLSAASPPSKVNPLFTSEEGQGNNVTHVEEMELQDIVLENSNLDVNDVTEEDKVTNKFNIVWMEKDSTSVDESSDHPLPPPLGLTLNSESLSASQSEKEAESNNSVLMEQEADVSLLNN